MAEGLFKYELNSTTIELIVDVSRACNSNPDYYDKDGMGWAGNSVFISYADKVLKIEDGEMTRDVYILLLGIAKFHEWKVELI